MRILYGSGVLGGSNTPRTTTVRAFQVLLRSSGMSTPREGIGERGDKPGEASPEMRFARFFMLPVRSL